jgi:ribosomal protein S18 acetylase RimI-like enzyme
MSVVYRDGTIADGEAIADIFRTGFCDTFAHLYSAQDLESFLSDFALERWRRELSDPQFAFRLAEEKGKPFGYIKLGPISLPVEDTADALELKQLYLLKERHGTGAASELMEWALAEAADRGARELYLSVYTENWRARRFYERYGFVFHAPYVFMVGGHPDEDMIMRREL